MSVLNIEQYSVTQSKSNSFWWYDVFDSFILAKRDEDSILDQSFEKQIFSAFYNEDLKFWEWFKKIHIYLKKFGTLQGGTHKIGF